MARFPHNKHHHLNNHSSKFQWKLTPLPELTFESKWPKFPRRRRHIKTTQQYFQLHTSFFDYSLSISQLTPPPLVPSVGRAVSCNHSQGLAVGFLQQFTSNVLVLPRILS
ncbi:hypothetical protein ANCCAN_28601 [Ancylostoma caninum]|uniref:Uncharacterized protein n=1 Tax=Ancylostoma caninum TaxID=29170 RepID=A0A368F0T9_ANCCA|nr:hypothetical protein ANCCAN_28601 [Ancylostoma caninum]